MYHFLPIAVRYDGTLPEGGGGHGYQVHVGPMYSDVRGTCKIVSADPRDKPALLFNYLSTENDRREWIEAIRVTREHPRRARLRAVQRRRAVARAARSTRTSRSSSGSRRTPRPRCTRRARAGWAPDDMAVVDPLTMKVHGTDGLRVVDASVFPYVTNGNIYAPVMMVAEKAADLILGNTPLPAEPVAVLPARRIGPESAQQRVQRQTSPAAS